MTVSSTPISTRMRILRHPCLILGAALGVCLAATAVAWVLLANNAPALAPFAFARNLAAALTFGALMLIPLFSFLRSPARVFLTGIIAWTILAIVYASMENAFPLPSQLGAFHVFMLGGIVFGVMASIAWVTRMIFSARHHHYHTIAVARRRLP